MIDASNKMSFPAASIPAMGESYNVTVQEYVEIIRDLVRENQVARVKDIADRRGVTRSSVSTALNTLLNLGLVEHEHYGYVSLTEDGKRLGENLTLRHTILQTFLENFVGLEAGAADREACILEHAMSPAALDGLVKFIQKAARFGLNKGRVAGVGRIERGTSNRVSE